MAFWGNIGAALKRAGKTVGTAIADEAADSAAHAVSEVSKDPRVKEALASAGKAASGPATAKITPMIWLAAAGVLVVLVVVIVLVRRKA